MLKKKKKKKKKLQLDIFFFFLLPFGMKGAEHFEAIDSQKNLLDLRLESIAPREA